jgi:hypothetical protein
MNRLKKAALLTQLIQGLREHGSWCGETHVQKATFFLQELMYVPMEFEFILYKHGPFSFDLRDELTALRADELIRLEPQWPYGPRIVSTSRGENLRKIFPKTLNKYNARIYFVAEKLAHKGVAELECLTTAFYITKRASSSASVDDGAEQLTQLKPHISLESARDAIEGVDRIIEEAREHVH